MSIWPKCNLNSFTFSSYRGDNHVTVKIVTSMQRHVFFAILYPVLAWTSPSDYNVITPSESAKIKIN